MTNPSKQIWRSSTNIYEVVTIIRYTRNHYHDLIKKIKTDRNSDVKRSLGNALQSGQTRNSWSEIYKISKAKGKKLFVAVNDLCTDEDIANLFAEQHELLCNSVITICEFVSVDV